MIPLSFNVNLLLLSSNYFPSVKSKYEYSLYREKRICIFNRLKFHGAEEISDRREARRWDINKVCHVNCHLGDIELVRSLLYVDVSIEQYCSNISILPALFILHPSSHGRREILTQTWKYHTAHSTQPPDTHNQCFVISDLV